MTFELLEWVLVFLLGIEAFQLELLLLVILFFATVIMQVGSKGIIIRSRFEFLFLFFSFLIYFFTLFVQSRASFSAYHIIRIFLGSTLAYIIGIKVCRGKVQKVDKLVYIIAISGLVHGLLNLISTTTLSTSSRYVNNFWTGGITTATLQGTYFTCSLAIAVVWLFDPDFRKKILGGIFAVIALINSFMTASRTAVYLFVILFIILYFYRAFKKGSTRGFLRVLMRTVLGIFFVFFVLYQAYNLNVFGIQTKFASTFLGIRISNISNENSLSRFETWRMGLQDMISNPFGHVKTQYAHNMWLDFGVNGGVVPFLFLLAFSISSLINCYRFLKNNAFDESTKTIILTVYIAYNLNFMVEPILDGVPFMFFMYCMICGAVQETNYMSSFIQREER